MIGLRDEELMKEALRLALENIAADGRPFGAIVVSQGTIVGRGTDRSILASDPTYHAELVAIREAASTVGLSAMHEATLYSTCEPCVMCSGAILRAGIPRLCYSVARATAVDHGFPDVVPAATCHRLLSQSVEVVQVLQAEGARLFATMPSADPDGCGLTSA